MQTIRHHRAMRNPPSIGPYLNHIPAHMPTDAPAAVLMAQVIAHDALNRAMRRAQSLDAGFHEDLAHNAVAHREAACGRSGGAEC